MELIFKTSAQRFQMRSWTTPSITTHTPPEKQRGKEEGVTLSKHMESIIW